MLNSLSGKRKPEREELEHFIAQEIHDGACQYALGAKMAFEAYRRTKTGTMSENLKHFETGLACLDNAIYELEQLVRGFSPIQLAAGSLPVAISCLIDDVRAAGGPALEFRHNVHRDQMSLELQHAAFRIVQESLANACRHSKSKRLLVELTLEGDLLRILVQDWGVGFNPDSPVPGHFGLDGIRRRAELLGGTATIASELGKGTRVNVQIPLESWR